MSDEDKLLLEAGYEEKTNQETICIDYETGYKRLQKELADTVEQLGKYKEALLRVCLNFKG